MKNILIIVFLLFSSFGQLRAQEIKIGQKVPDVLIPHVLNYKKSSANLLKDFGGKPLIIDFWFTYCGPCINFMPTLDKLQLDFDKRFNVLQVTFEPSSAIVPFFQKHPSLGKLKIPTVTGDKKLEQMFPHSTDPHEIWIDKNGVVQAITSATEVTAENLKLFVEGKPLNLPMKVEILDNKVAMGVYPLVYIDQQYNQGRSIQQYTNFSNWIPGIISMRQGALYENGIIRIKLMNVSLQSIYSIAYSQELEKVGLYPKLRSNQLIANEKLFSGEQIQNIVIPNFTTGENLFCYDLILRDTSRLKAYSLMKRDVDGYFRVSSKLEKRLIKAYVLKRNSTTDKVNSSKHIVGEPKETSAEVIYENYNWGLFSGNLVDVFRVNADAYPFVDETGFDKSKSINIVMPLRSTYGSGQREVLNTLKLALNKYDLDLVIEDRELWCVVLENK